MNILYISYDGMTDPLGQSQVIPYLKGLSKNGNQISLISCEKKEKFQSGKVTIQKTLNESNIIWMPVSYSSLFSVFSKRINLYKIRIKAEKHCKQNQINIVHCRSYMAALIGLKLKQKYGLKFIFDMRGFWADERIDGKIWNLNNNLHKRIYNYFKKKEIEFLTNADFTISLTQSAKDEILSWKQFIINKVPIEVIPCCVDLSLFSNRNINKLELETIKSRLHFSGTDFILSYLGSIGTWYMLDEMLDFFKVLSEIKTNSKFLFITHDNKDEILLKAKEKEIATDKIIIYSAKRSEVPLYLSLSDISIYFIKPLYSKKASSPTKTGEIMAMGIPIITNSGIGDSDQIIKDSGGGLLINSFTKEEYKKIINKIDVLLKTDKERIMETAQNYFSLEKGIELYQSVYDKVINIK